MSKLKAEVSTATAEKNIFVAQLTKYQEIFPTAVGAKHSKEDCNSMRKRLDEAEKCQEEMEAKANDLTLQVTRLQNELEHRGK